MRKFREFRWTRPFWGGLLILFAGAVIFVLPLSPITTIVYAGLGAIGGIVLGLILIFLGLMVWLRPEHKNTAGILAVIAGLVSFPVTNLGGFVTGMLSAVIGGSLAFGWTLPKSHEDRDVVDVEPKGAPV